MILNHNMNSPNNLIFVLSIYQVILRLQSYTVIDFYDSISLVLFQIIINEWKQVIRAKDTFKLSLFFIRKKESNFSTKKAFPKQWVS